MRNEKNLTPLRYPGGKRCLASIVHKTFLKQTSKVDLLIEPFAGSAAISISALESGFANKIILSDLDKLVAAFWKTVFSSRAKQLAKKILECDISLETWDRLKASNPKDYLERAFKCIFINRCAFSGIMHSSAGPIGGKEQLGEYKIDARFNRQALANRIIELSKLRKRVLKVYNCDWRKTISRTNQYLASRSKVIPFWYLDPPFFEKADKLYNHCFNNKQHKALRDSLNDLRGYWMLSYDDCSTSRKYYRHHAGYIELPLTYSAATKSGQRKQIKELLITNCLGRSEELIYDKISNKKAAA